MKDKSETKLMITKTEDMCNKPLLKLVLDMVLGLTLFLAVLVFAFIGAGQYLVLIAIWPDLAPGKIIRHKYLTTGVAVDGFCMASDLQPWLAKNGHKTPYVNIYQYCPHEEDDTEEEEEDDVEASTFYAVQEFSADPVEIGAHTEILVLPGIPQSGIPRSEVSQQSLSLSCLQRGLYLFLGVLIIFIIDGGWTVILTSEFWGRDPFGYEFVAVFSFGLLLAVIQINFNVVNSRYSRIVVHPRKVLPRSLRRKNKDKETNGGNTTSSLRHRNNIGDNGTMMTMMIEDEDDDDDETTATKTTLVSNNEHCELQVV